jgi:hypothetical protein
LACLADDLLGHVRRWELTASPTLTWGDGGRAGTAELQMTVSAATIQRWQPGSGVLLVML